MCLEDITIERQYKSRVYVTQSTIDIPANANRVAVRILAAPGEIALLSAVAGSFIGTGGNNFVPIGRSANDPNTVNFSGAPFSLPDDITLAKVGDLLKGPLVLTAMATVAAWAIEVYLDIDTPTSMDVTKLPKPK